MASPRTSITFDGVVPFHLSIDVPNRTLTVAGEIDLATETLLLDGVDVLAATDGDITVDVADVTFMDSVALGAFEKVAIQQQAHGHELMVVNPTARHRRLFMICGLAQMLRTPST